MVALSDLTFLARNIAGGIKNVAGSTITVALATLARGLAKTGDIDIDASGPSTTTLSIQNSTPGQRCNVSADGYAEFNSYVAATGLYSYNDVVSVQRNPSNGNRFDLTGTPTAVRTITFPDASGTVALTGSASSIPVASKVAIHALPAPSAPIIYYCNNIVGASGGGVTGALVYYNTVTALWLRVSDDNPF